MKWLKRCNACSSLRERDIQTLIDSYECEWSRTLNEEQALQRFSHFINSDKRDPDVQFVSERDQHRPATPAERIPVYQIEVETK